MMTREEIMAGVESLEPWFHKIDLGRGLTTKTKSYAGEPADHPTSTWKIIERCLPEDLSGKSLLDVGCNAGFYSVEARRRGAAPVLGVDAQRHHIRQAQFVRRALGLDIQYRRMSVYDLDARAVGLFDITLALGLIYHCKHLILALEKLFQVTRELLIIETAIIPAQSWRGSFARWRRATERSVHPLAYVENTPDSKESIYNWFYPSADALQALLRDTGFDEVGLFDVSGDRAVLVCRKRRPYPDSFDLSYLDAALTLEDGPTVCSTDADVRFRIRVENTGQARWLSAGEPETDRGAVRLAAHLLKENEEDLSWYHAGARLVRDLLPGEAASLQLTLRAPQRPGNYLVEFDMLVEHLAWFEDLGSTTLKHPLRVE